jgi:hypothetical protein
MLTKDNVLAAMELFNDKLRNTAPWINWEANRSHLYAIEYKRHRYPVKKIASLGSGVPVDQLHGGPGRANRLLEDLDFEIVLLHQPT